MINREINKNDGWCKSQVHTILHRTEFIYQFGLLLNNVTIS